MACPSNATVFHTTKRAFAGVRVRSGRDVHGPEVRRAHRNRHAPDTGRRRHVRRKLQHVVLHKRGRVQKLWRVQAVDQNLPEVRVSRCFSMRFHSCVFAVANDFSGR